MWLGSVPWGRDDLDHSSSEINASTPLRPRRDPKRVRDDPRVRRDDNGICPGLELGVPLCVVSVGVSVNHHEVSDPPAEPVVFG